MNRSDSNVSAVSAGSSAVAWALTTGEAGMRSQARGLAEACGLPVVEKVVGLRDPWSWLPGHLVPVPLFGLTSGSDAVSPPWPALLVTCGRRSTAISIALRRLSGGRTVTVHVQNPLCRLDAFDLIVPMRHDGVQGSNVLDIDTALHGITPAKLAEAREVWRSRFAALPRPLVGVVLGGKNRDYAFTLNRAQSLLAGLDRLRAATGCGIAITPSRRTEPEVKALIARHYAGDEGVYVWDETGDNPYAAILGLADRLVVTTDSVSMVSEALATGCPVEIFALEGRARRHEMFVDNLIQRRLVRRFTGEAVSGPVQAPIDATEIVAERVKMLLAARI